MIQISSNFPTSLDSYATLVDNTDDVLAAIPNNHADAIEALEAKVGIDSSAVVTSLDYLLKSASSVDPGHLHSVYGDFIASGRKLWIYENVAVTGWTIVAVTDAVLAVKGGSNDYNVSGGQTGGSWTWPSHTLTSADIPAHTHTMGSNDSTAGDSSTPNLREFIRDSGSGNGLECTSSSTGSGGAHSHGSTTFRPLACIGIIIQKT